MSRFLILLQAAALPVVIDVCVRRTGSSWSNFTLSFLAMASIALCILCILYPSDICHLSLLSP